MIYTLPEVKKEMKAMNSVIKVTVHLEEFGEGYDAYVNIDYLDRFNNKEFNYYQMGEEEKLGKAEGRGKRIVTSLQNAGYKATYEGVANC